MSRTDLMEKSGKCSSHSGCPSLWQEDPIHVQLLIGSIISRDPKMTRYPAQDGGLLMVRNKFLVSTLSKQAIIMNFRVGRFT